jgi:hypothetical protein
LYINVMPAFWHAWDSTQGKSAAARAAAFKEAVILPNLGVYANGEFADELVSDDQIATYLDGLELRIGELRALSDRVSTEIPGDVERVQAELPGLSLEKISIYVLPSFELFNGQTADLGERTAVLFGVDGLLYYDGPRVNVGVTVAHELFHIYQAQTHPGNSTNGALVWQAVWREGSAAYASQQLAVDATKQLALGAQLAGASSDATRALACFVQRHWSSGDENDVTALLNADAHPVGLPSRGGYLVGYLGALDFAKTHTLAQLGSAPLGQVEPALKMSVDRLCATGA